MYLKSFLVSNIQHFQNTFTINSSTVRHFSLKKLLIMYRSLTPANPSKPPYNHVVQIGDPILRDIATDVPEDLIQSPEIKFLIKKLTTVMKQHGCAGMAAPQIGVPLRLFIMELSKKDKKAVSEQEFKNKNMSFIPFTVFINPKLKITDYKQVAFTETCGSVKGYAADVPRYLGVQCTGFNELGELKTLDARDWTARIIQHEIDHLDGKLYIDVMNKKSFMCTCWQAVNAYQGQIELPFYGK